MEKFLREYTENLITAINEGTTSLENIQLNCAFCPLSNKCHEEAESGEDDTPCVKYIMNHYT